MFIALIGIYNHTYRYYSLSLELVLKINNIIKPLDFKFGVIENILFFLKTSEQAKHVIGDE